MRGRRRKKRRAQHLVGDIELMPMLNVFISIIPLLLLSATFVPISILQTALPSLGAAAAEPDDGPIELAIRIRAEAYLIEVNGQMAASIPRPEPSAVAGAAAEAASARLTAALREVAAGLSGEREVRILSAPATRYEEIITVMDAARAAGMPDVALAEAPAEGV